MYDVLIIGGGIIGCAIARELSRYTLKIALLEREPDLAMGATKANSAIVHGGYAEAHTKVKGRLCYKGRQQFAALDGDLHFGFRPIGSMVLAFEESQRSQLVALMDNGRRNGVDDLELLDTRQILALEPGVSPSVKHALYCRGAGICSPFEMAIALAESAAENGAEIHLRCGVTGIARVGDRFSVQTQSGTPFEARYLVNAGGLASGDLSAMAGDSSFAVHPRSGEYIVLNKGSGDMANTVLFQMPTIMGKGILVTPTIYGNLLIGPDAIDEQRNDRDTHVERLRAVYAQARITMPALDLKRFLRSFAGVRAVSSTDDFVLGASSVPGFIQAAGIQSPGLTSSPAIAQVVRDALADQGLTLREKEGFVKERRGFLRPEADLDAAALQARISLPQGAAGRILCRCEQVPEAAAVDALARGLPLHTVDAIKRRVRAGMGLCQGAFCRPRTAALLTSLQGFTVDAATDVERAGLHRVERAEMLRYLQRYPVE